MRATERSSMWARLRDGGLVEGEMPVSGEAHTPWFVRVLLGIGGWLGALFLLGFVAAGFALVLKNEGAAFVVGAAACAAAVAIFRLAPRNDFLAQAGLATSLAGQVLLVFAVSQWAGRAPDSLALYVAVQQAVLFLVAPDFVHRLWTSWSATVAASIVLMDAGGGRFAPALITAAFAWVALSEFKWARHAEWVRPALYGLALAAVQTAVFYPDAMAGWIMHRGVGMLPSGSALVWLARALSLAVLLWAMLTLMQQHRLAMGSRMGRLAVAGVLVLGLVTLKAPGVGPAVMVLILGYANADRVLSGLGILALLGYLSYYYYSLQITLLEKSGLLAATGLLLLGARLLLHRLNRPVGPAEVPHA